MLDKLFDTCAEGLTDFVTAREALLVLVADSERLVAREAEVVEVAVWLIEPIMDLVTVADAVEVRVRDDDAVAVAERPGVFV